MHVLMLGWEFPPFITGGLGTACFGLTRAMDRRGTRVTFVLPKSVEGNHAEHVTLVSPYSQLAHVGETVEWITLPHRTADGDQPEQVVRGRAVVQQAEITAKEKRFSNVDFIDVPAGFSNPYQKEPGRRAVGGERIEEIASQPGARRAIDQVDEAVETSGHATKPETEEDMVRRAVGREEGTGDLPRAAAAHSESDYNGDIVSQAERYAHFVLAATRGLDFDIIHAHDWMTYPAGLAIARITGKPLVVHIHSTEFDRSGDHVNQRIYDIERRGMHGALRVIAVSQLTKNVVVNRYGLPDHRVEVVYNGVDLEPTSVGLTGIRSRDKIVLYFGRITYQKGPEYFIHAAKKVLDYTDDVKFVVAGSGDQAKRMIELAAELGIGHKVLFTGFLRGNDIKRVFKLADLYVMPSVSEPFGIAPLEAMSHNVPVLISKSSGVSEVLTHALKVDFWDIEDMANKIIAVLKYPPLSQTLQEHGAFEVRRLTWDGAAERCEQVYRAVMSEIAGHAAVR